MPNYRGFSKPQFADGQHSVLDWMNWLDSLGALAPFAPRPLESCSMCGGPVGLSYEGDRFAYCAHCRAYTRSIDLLVPAVYSFTNTIESMLHRYKDFGDQYRWLNLPLGSLTSMFVRDHLACIDNHLGGIDVVVKIPSNNRTRGFDHLDLLLNSVEGGATLNLDDEVLTRDHTVTRPRRGELKPEAYDVVDEAVAGRTVLVFDDLWTSGSSAASAAAALKNAGADTVAVMTIGRQLNGANGYENSADLVTEARERDWEGSGCVVCS
ncbi:ComF family protein [Aeromicrobium wangtongii]|uniref:ComF family protein n=1 Tax=Aeromicrobium wangtongii TaxID=2969247 RepID=A0ABY5MCN4_9ACTN|nr:hypothetical protein [Aeromicrobium wangtongii]MCD9197472.1 hypothetical protein [Aeromicrobium wangtongii]UUP14964.1 hypothetical protein NQV15_06545 [Aeromicrobium wangtongii]